MLSVDWAIVAAYVLLDGSPLVYQPETQVTVAPSVQREVCYNTGCYHLQGDGVTAPYQWVWVPAAPPPPPWTR